MDDEYRPDLEKLRRFALAIALVLITYSLTLEFDPDEGVRPLGLPFKVVRPELLPIGLMLASIYGAVRFWYYGIMKEESPVRQRRRVIGGAGFDSRFHASHPMYQPEDQRETFADQFQKHFPRVFASSVSLEWELAEKGSLAQDVQETFRYEPLFRVVRLKVPLRTRCAMFLEQVDYTAPVWLNIVVLGTIAVQIFRS